MNVPNVPEILWLVTAYATGCDTKPNHPTKAGTMPVPGFTAAADPRVLPIGSIVWIDGLGERMIHDIGGKVKGRHIDVFMDNCRDAWRATSRRRVKVLHIGGE